MLITAPLIGGTTDANSATTAEADAIASAVSSCRPTPLGASLNCLIMELRPMLRRARFSRFMIGLVSTERRASLNR